MRSVKASGMQTTQMTGGMWARGYGTLRRGTDRNRDRFRSDSQGGAGGVVGQSTIDAYRGGDDDGTVGPAWPDIPLKPGI